MSIKEKYDFFDDDDEVVEQEPVVIETPEEKEEKEIANDTIKRGYNRLRLTLYSIVAVVFISLFPWLWLRDFPRYT